MKIEIEVPDNLGKQFLMMNYQQKVAFHTAFAKLFYLWLSPPQDDILTIMDRLGKEAATKGMTPEILNQLLDEED